MKHSNLLIEPIPTWITREAFIYLTLLLLSIIISLFTLKIPNYLDVTVMINPVIVSKNILTYETSNSKLVVLVSTGINNYQRLKKNRTLTFQLEGTEFKGKIVTNGIRFINNNLVFSTEIESKNKHFLLNVVNTSVKGKILIADEKMLNILFYSFHIGREI